ncbi:hypothetical protein L2E82_02180 [Cichorium intybus]|uniref:Uncharacterized protein n=2 Tax=Cichorium intybus TaxID=13427 RepID=A0ACB9H0X8_CICIN|nr:hypothetical protein L2E82_01754 [Cichorium intybus]KAI3789387.1 hypothetical protein L2E82_02180 [Cichorium intybus]
MSLERTRMGSSPEATRSELHSSSSIYLSLSVIERPDRNSTLRHSNRESAVEDRRWLRFRLRISNGGDPCGENWKGVTCLGSRVTKMYSTLSVYIPV